MPFPLADEQDYDYISNIYVHLLLEAFFYILPPGMLQWTTRSGDLGSVSSFQQTLV